MKVEHTILFLSLNILLIPKSGYIMILLFYFHEKKKKKLINNILKSTLLLFSFSVERIAMFDNSYEREEKEGSKKEKSFPVQIFTKSCQVLFKYE